MQLGFHELDLFYLGASLGRMELGLGSGHVFSGDHTRLSSVQSLITGDLSLHHRGLGICLIELGFLALISSLR